MDDYGNCEETVAELKAQLAAEKEARLLDNAPGLQWQLEQSRQLSAAARAELAAEFKERLAMAAERNEYRTRAEQAEAARVRLDAACAKECCAHAETIERLALAEAAMLAQAQPCHWVEAGEGYWISGCNGKSYYIESGTPADVGYLFCPQCSHPLAWQSGPAWPQEASALAAVLAAAARLA